MCEVELTVHCDMRGRGVTQLIQRANEFKSAIWIDYHGERANAKHLLSVVSLGIPAGAVILLTTDGKDEERAVHVLSEVIESLSQ